MLDRYRFFDCGIIDSLIMMLRGVLLILWLIVIVIVIAITVSRCTTDVSQEVLYTCFCCVERAYASAPPRINLEFESSKHVRKYGLWISES